MNNRTLLYMTVAVLIGMAILFLLNLKNIVTGQDTGLQTYLKYNEVRGMGVMKNKLIYTLNFEQQNQVITFLNQSVPVKDLGTKERESPDFEQLIIYQFSDKPNITIVPIAYMNNQLVYSNPEWNAAGYLMEMSNGRFRTLISETYDP